MGDAGTSPDPYPPVPLEMPCSPLTQHMHSLSESGWWLGVPCATLTPRVSELLINLDKGIWQNLSCREPGKAHLTACAQLCCALLKVSSILSQKSPLISSKSASCVFTFQAGQH